MDMMAGSLWQRERGREGERKRGKGVFIMKGVVSIVLGACA